MEVNRKSKADGQHIFCAILGTPTGVPKIKHQADIGAVEPNRTVEADVQQKCGAILSAPIGVPEI